MKMNPQAFIPAKDQLTQFCQQHGINKLAVFGSALRSDFRPDSDIDLLVKFQPGQTPGLFKIVGIETELSSFFGQRKIDLRTLEDLSPYFRAKVVSEAEVLVELPVLIDQIENILGPETHIPNSPTSW